MFDISSNRTPLMCSGLLAMAMSLCAAPLSASAQEQPAIKREPAISTAAVNTAFLKDQDDVSAVTQIVLRERQGRDRGWWDQMLATYWPDSRVDLSWYHGDGPGFVYGSRAMYERGAQPVHRMFAPVVDLKGNKAHVEVGALTWSTLEVKGVTANFETSMRLNYRLEKRNGEWRILAMQPVYEYATVSPAAPGETINISAQDLAPYRPSYALLSWNMAQRGYKLSQDEIGVDRPQELTKFYAAIKQWLNN